MSFEDKRIKVSRFVITDGWTEEDRRNALENIRKHLALPLDQVMGEEADVGWASGRAELNLDISEDECFIGEYIYIAMRIAVRKVPAGIAKALCRKKEDEYRKANMTSFVSRKERQRIKEEVHDHLIPRTMPTVKSVWAVITPSGIVYAGTASRTEKGQFGELFCKTFGKEAVERNFFTVIGKEDAAAIVCDNPDLEFLTDLFRQTDQDESGNFFAYAPFDFISPDGDGLCTRALAAGDGANLSEEVRTALREKKLLRKLKLCVTDLPGYDEHDRWEFVLNRDWGISGLQTPEGEEMEFSARFAEKAAMLDACFEWIDGKAREFAERASNPEYPGRKAAWIAAR